MPRYMVERTFADGLHIPVNEEGAATGMTKGNLSSHTARLEAAGYIEVVKAFRGRMPVTSFRMMPAGRAALAAYLARLRAALPEPPADRPPARG